MERRDIRNLSLVEVSCMLKDLVSSSFTLICATVSRVAVESLASLGHCYLRI